MSLKPLILDVTPFPMRGKVSIPPSKSYGNRLLILASLISEEVLISPLPLSRDVFQMIKALREVGLIIEKRKNSILVKNSFPSCERKGPHRLETGDGGTTNRFLLPFLARGRESYELIPRGEMVNRPMGPLIEGLSSLGVDLSWSKKEGSWLKVRGPATLPKEIFVDSSLSTQFATGLALAFADKETRVCPEKLSSSSLYWDLTVDLIHKFKKGKLDFSIPVDFSSMSYPLALAAVTGEVLIDNCFSPDPFQADSQFINLLKMMGTEVEFTKEGLRCRKKNLCGLEFDGSQCPDIIPTLLYICSFAKGESLLRNLKVLTYKESNRFEEMIRMLKTFGVRIEVDREKYDIRILGRDDISLALNYDPPQDHRMIMVAYLFMRTLKGGRLSQVEHVGKSFENFFDIMQGS